MPARAMKLLLTVACFGFACGIGQIIPVSLTRFFRRQWPLDTRALFLLLCAVLIVASFVRIQTLRSSVSPWKSTAVGFWVGLAAGAFVIFLYGVPSGWTFLLR